MEPLILPRGRVLSLARPVVMGVLNTTPDSFSDGGRFLSVETALIQARSLVEAGAGIVDIGGESTRPGSESVSAKVQIGRVVPVIEALRQASDVAISIDTTSAMVAKAAIQAGADIINDISAFRFDADMLSLVATSGLPAVAMHTLGAPKTMQSEPAYLDVVNEVVAHLATRAQAFLAAGGKRHQLVLDPGFGFGKTAEHNIELLASLDRLVALGFPVLVGTSRKRFLGAITGRPTGERGPATAASVAIAVSRGAHIVRVHDPSEVKDAVAVGGAVYRRSL